MHVYARIDNGVVVEIIQPMTYDDGSEIPITERFPADFIATLVDITDVDPQPQDWWLYDGANFRPPAYEAEV